MAGHVAPEAAHRGPIAALKDGDTITFDIENRTLSVDLPTTRSKPAWQTGRSPTPILDRRNGEVRGPRLLGLEGRRQRIPTSVPRSTTNSQAPHLFRSSPLASPTVEAMASSRGVA